MTRSSVRRHGWLFFRTCSLEHNWIRSLLDHFEEAWPLEPTDPGLEHGQAGFVCLAVRRALDLSGQATKGTWGMSWHRKAMKGVEVCEKPGGVDKRALILGFPNCRLR